MKIIDPLILNLCGGCNAGGLVNQSHFGLPMDFAVMFTTMILLSGFLLTVSKG